MSTTDVAEKYYSLFKENKMQEIIQELYSPMIVSIEPENNLGLPVQTEGIENYGQKQGLFFSQIEQVFGGSIEKPLVANNHFTVLTTSDVQFKGVGRIQRNEISVFEVKDGKIVKEQFFYNA